MLLHLELLHQVHTLFSFVRTFIHSLTHTGGEIVLKQPSTSQKTVITLLGAEDSTLTFSDKSDGLYISFPTTLPFSSLVGKGAWTIKLTYVM